MLHDTRLKALHEFDQVFDDLVENERALANASAKERIARLKRLKQAILDNRTNIQEALHADFNKPPAEVDVVDIFPVVKAIRYTTRHLRGWMQDRSVATPLAMIGSRSYVRMQGKGVALIISPWNYPINLALSPLVSAIAAGCPVVIKPSEHAPHAARVMRQIITNCFPANEVFVQEGGVEVGKELLTYKFRHIHYTGGGQVGKIIMRAAADHLASVTLELGGKSPAFIDTSIHVKQVARRLLQTKWTNAGQTCVGPDYLLVDERIVDKLLSEIKSLMPTYYPLNEPGHFTSIVNQTHFDRLSGYLEEAVESGTDIWTAGDTDASRRLIPPTLVMNPALGSAIMNEEIFGPILIVRTYKNLADAIALVQSKDKPLTLSIYSRSEAYIRKVMHSTEAGSTAINHSAVHYYVDSLPFGGVNESGIGKGLGYYGFKSFSNERGVYKQTWYFSPHEWLHNPYGKWKKRFLNFIINRL